MISVQPVPIWAEALGASAPTRTRGASQRRTRADRWVMGCILHHPPLHASPVRGMQEVVAPGEWQGPMAVKKQAVPSDAIARPPASSQKFRRGPFDHFFAHQRMLRAFVAGM